MTTTNHHNDDTTRWGVQRQIDGQYFDGDGWTDDENLAFRTDHDHAVNLAAYLLRITPGWVRAVLIAE